MFGNALIANYWNLNLRDIETLVSILAFTAMAFLGIAIFSSNWKSWTNRLFMLLIIVFDAYIFVNYFSLHPSSDDPNTRLYWIRMVMFTASLKAPLLFLLVHTLPSEKLLLSRAKTLGTVVIMSAAAAASISPYVFISIIDLRGQPTPVQGPLMPLFFLNFIGFVIASFITLFAKYRRSAGAERARQLFLLLGIFISFTGFLIFSLILVVIFQVTSFVFLGPIFLVLLAGSIGYTMAKHQLFGVKVIAATILVVILNLVLFSKLFVAQTRVGFAIDLSVFLATLIFGMSLIRSVRREVSQREELQRLTVNLEESNRKLQELDKLKSEFLSFASHQVKAPLSVIKGFASLISDGSYGTVPEKVIETSHKIKDSADRLLALVSNLLDLRKIQEGHMDFSLEIMDVRQLLMHVAEEMKSLADKKGLSFSFEAPPESVAVSLDEQKFRQVIQNLLDNAIKYTDTGWVKMTLKNEPEKHSVLICISDSGRGMPPELIPQLFEQFTRGKATSAHIAGTGLGLYIAKEIISGHKGEIWAASEGEGKGSGFFIRLPLP